MKMNSDNRINKLLRGTVIYGIGNFGTKIITFLLVPLYTYYISTEDMGEYDLVTTTVSLLTPLITLRISDAAYRWILRNETDKKDCISATYRVLVFSSLLVAGSVCLLSIWVPFKYSFYFMALLILGRWFESLQTLLRGVKRRKLFSIVGVIYTLVFVGNNLVRIVWLKEGVVSLFQSSIIAYVFSIIVMIIFAPELRTRVIRTHDNAQLSMEMLRYSAPLVPSGLSWWIMSASDRYVMAFILGKSATGIFSVANKFPSIVSILYTLFGNSWTDLIFSDFSEGKETSDYSSRIFRELYIISFSFVLFMMPATKILCQQILSGEYKSGAYYTSFLYLGAVFQGFTATISANFLQTRTGSRYIAKSSMVGAAINLCIDILFMNLIGIHAASVSTFVGFFVTWCIRMKDSHNINPIHLDVLHFGKWFIAVIVIAVIVIFSNRTIDTLLSVVFLIFFVIVNRKYIFKVIELITKRKG